MGDYPLGRKMRSYWRQAIAPGSPARSRARVPAWLRSPESW